MKIKAVIFAGLAVVLVAPALFLSACGQSGPPAETQPTFTSPPKGNPKLDSQLDQLVQAQAGGEVTALARQMNIDLSDGRIRVVIECLPGQVEAASRAAVDSGAVLETTYEDLLQASVPVASLTALAAAESIRFIRLPQQPVPLIVK